MRQVREVLRLMTARVGLNQVARRVGVAPSTVRLTLKRVAIAGLSWPLPLGYRLPSRPIVREAMSELHRRQPQSDCPPCERDRRHARPCRAARHPGRARSRRALCPRSMIQRGLPREWSPYGRSVRPAIAQTRWHRYSHSCVEPSLWLRRRFHKPRPGFETHRRRGPSNGIDKATLAARLLGHCRREHARPLFWGQAYLSVADAYLFIEAQR